jgi:hypothetical protein
MTLDRNQSSEFILSEDDYADFSHYAFKRNMKRYWGQLLRRVGLLMLLWFAASVLYGRWSLGDALIQWNDWTIIVVFLYLLLLPQITRWIARLRYRTVAFAKFRDPRRIAVSSVGFHSTGGVADSMTPWSSISAIDVAPDAAYLFLATGGAHIVPRHAFVNEAAFMDLVAAALNFRRPGGGSTT